MFEVGTSKPTSGYQINTDSYVYRSPFGQIVIYIDINATVVQSTWHIVAYVPQGYRPSNFITMDAYIADADGSLMPIYCFVYHDGNVKVLTNKPTGSYRLLINGSYFILHG